VDGVIQNRRIMVKSGIVKSLVFILVIFLLNLISICLFAQNMEPLKIELPFPMFIGTPQNFNVDKLEMPSEIPRPPFYAPVGTENVALGKYIESTDEEPLIGDIELITDGDKEATDGSFVEFRSGKQYITIDLESVHEIYAILIWHFHKKARVYKDVIIQVSSDPDFVIDVETLFNNDHDNSSGLGVGEDLHYVETHEGKLIDAKGVHGQYVRLYSNGNTYNELNHYIEVEVYGKQVE